MQKPTLEDLKGHHLGTPGHSLALRYEMALQESEGGVAPTLSRVNLCFEVLDDILPHLGVYQRVMQLIREELHLAVYSSDWTSGLARHASKESSSSKLMPLPYFVIAQRLMERRAGEHSKLKVEITSLKEQLYMCEADLEKALSSLETCRHDFKEKDAKLHQLTSELRTHCAEKEHLQKVIGQHQQSQERVCQEFDYRMFTLRNAIANLKEENGYLKVFKQTHDKLQETQLITPPTTASPTVLANTKTEMDQHHATTEKLKIQLLSLQNSLTDELDAFLLSCISDKIPLSSVDMAQKKKTFKQQIAAITEELSLLEKHQDALDGRSEQLKSDKKSSEHMALVLPLHPLNPLIPQEQASSKYALMVHISSDGGKTFYPLKGAQHCLSCSHKTVVCPHKAGKREMVVQLPMNSSHLKISRPSFTLVQATPPKQISVPQNIVASTPMSQGLHVAVPDFGYLWLQFSKNFPGFELLIPRNISKEQLLVLVELFYARLLQQDDKVLHSDDDEDLLILPESLFEFLTQHYFVRSLAPISCHTFISSLTEFYSHDKELLVLSHVLCGDLDGSALRYMLLQASLVESVTWNSYSQLPSFFTSLYPFLGEEDVEQLGLDYVAHSGNSLSASLVLDFLIGLLLRHKDPLIVMLEGQLTEHPCRTIGLMLEVEFAEAVEAAVPINSDLLCRQLFLQSLVFFQQKNKSSKKTLPIRNLAYIAAYLHRSRTKAADLKKTTSRGSKHQADEAGVKLHTMETVRSIGNKIKRLKTQ